MPFDNTCINVFPMKDKMYATTESEFLFQIDPKTLETLKKVDLGKEFPADVTISSMTAHPHVTPDGSVINVSATFGTSPSYNIICIPPYTGETRETPLEGGKVICSIPPTSGIGYHHSFCLTENFIVVTEVPLMLNIWRFLGHRFFGTSLEDWLYWDPKQRTRFHVVDRKKGDRHGVFTADPFFVFHHINAFEKDGKIHVDGCCYRDNSPVKEFYLHNLRSPAEPGQKKFATPYVRRYELPIDKLGSVEEMPLQRGEDGKDFTLLLIGMELPRINYEEYNGKPYKFVYGARSLDHQALFGKIVKLNLETGEFVTWEEPGGFASEPVFVKAPGGKEEDDGVILSCVINVIDQTTSLHVLDAKDLKELGRGVVEGVTPVSIHGVFQ